MDNGGHTESKEAAETIFCIKLKQLVQGKYLFNNCVTAIQKGKYESKFKHSLQRHMVYKQYSEYSQKHYKQYI